MSFFHPADPVSRRDALKATGMSIGWLAAQQLLCQESTASAAVGGLDLRHRQGHQPGRIKSVIMLTQVGGPSQMDLFDPKPELTRLNGKTHPDTFETLQPGSESKLLLGTPFPFKKHGDCGMDFSNQVPHLAALADDLCMVRSMYSANNNHPQAQRFLHSGKTQANWPTFGSWICYGLGTENQNMPAFVVLRDPNGYTDGGSNHWTSGWLPAIFGGTEIRSEGDAVLNLHPTRKVNASVRQQKMELLAALNRRRQQRYPSDTRLESRIQNYELAARMQINAERLLDLSGETQDTLSAYGADNKLTHDFGTRCIMARRMVESGVRFVEVMVPIAVHTSPFDNHRAVKKGLEAICPRIDQPSAALITDLKQRGLLDSTLVIWSGEFGRLPISQNGDGRDHNRNAFTLLLAGGGFKAGFTYGETDDIGYHATVNRVSVHDLHATILHQLGIDHHQLGFAHEGREERLTDPEVTGARVVKDLLA